MHVSIKYKNYTYQIIIITHRKNHFDRDSLIKIKK